ncbi:MAG: flagellar hook-length control protein FliK, partial [Acidobacteriota bacterium]
SNKTNATVTNNLVVDNRKAETTDTIATTDESGEIGTMLARQLYKPIAEATNTLANQQTRKLQIHLHPEQFGKVEIEITRDSHGRLNAQIVTETAVACDLLTEGITSLRESLTEAGLTVDHLAVRAESGENGGLNNRYEGNQDNDQNHNNNITLPSKSLDEESAPTNTGNTQNRLLSLHI